MSATASIAPPRARRRRPARAGARGFTLLEILVVMVIIALVSVSLLLSINLTGNDSMLEKESQRITELINLAREQASLQTREYGLLCQEDGYQFLSFDVRRNLWRTLSDDDDLRPRTLPAGIALKLSVEGHAIVLTKPEKDALKEKDADEDKDDADALKPQIMIFSNGDLTSFDLTLQRSNSTSGVDITQDDKGELVQKSTAGGSSHGRS